MSEQEQTEHADYDNATRLASGVIVEFAKGAAARFDAVEVMRIFMGASALMLAATLGREGAVTQLRKLATRLERGEPPTMN